MSLPTSWVFLLCLAPAPSAQSSAFARLNGQTAELGNRYLRRHVELTPVLRTTAIVNALTGRVFSTTSKELTISVDGREAPLTNRDLIPSGKPTVRHDATHHSIVVPLCNKDMGLEVTVTYSIGNDHFWTEKTLTVEAGERVVRDIEVECLKFGDAEIVRHDQKGANIGPWRIPIGRPLYVADELFLGLAYPAGHNVVDERRLVALRHFPGRKGTIVSKTAVIGVSPNQANNRVCDWFLKYIDRVRARPVKRFTLWDAYHNDREEAIRERFAVARDCFNKRGVRIDCALMDGGWTDPSSVMKIHPKRPERLAFVRTLAKEQLECALGLHVITSGSRGSVDHKWLAQHFGMIHGKSYCHADPRVAAEFQHNLLEYVKTYDVAAYKFDWGNFTCRKGDHRGHLPGEDYAREAITDSFIACLTALRKAKPDILLYNTGWYSPWWLMYHDALFSAGGDYNYAMAGPPSLTENDLQTTWRDGVLRQNFHERHPQFPLSSLMNHSPINWGWGSWKYSPPNPLDRFTDMILMNYLRGTQFIEFYLNLAALSAEDRDSLATIMKWSSANDDVLLADSRFILGDPRGGEAYGYSHFAEDGRGILAFRNPLIVPRPAQIVLDEATGMRADAGPCWVSVIYPYLLTASEPLAFGDPIVFEVGSFQTVVVSVTPTRLCATPLPLAVRYEVVGESADTISYRVLGPSRSDAGIRFSDGKVRPAAFPEGSSAARVTASKASTARSSPHTVAISLRVDIPAGARARLVGLQAAESAAHQQNISCEIRCGGELVETQRMVNANHRPTRGIRPGWVMTQGWLPGSGETQCEVRCDPQAVDRKQYESLPFEPVAQPGDSAAKPKPFQLWLMTEEPLPTSEPIEVSRKPSGHRPPFGLPRYWQRLRRATHLLIQDPRGVPSGVSFGAVYTVKVGAKPYTDRNVLIRAIPKELAGLPSIRFSHTHAKTDSSLRFSAKHPIRVYIAFGPKRATDQWLDPQPGWEIYKEDAFECDNKDVGKHIFHRDFAAGKVVLFEKQRGNYVLLGIVALRRE